MSQSEPKAQQHGNQQQSGSSSEVVDRSSQLQRAREGKKFLEGGLSKTKSKRQGLKQELDSLKSNADSQDVPAKQKELEQLEAQIKGIEQQCAQTDKQIEELIKNQEEFERIAAIKREQQRLRKQEERIRQQKQANFNKRKDEAAQQLKKLEQDLKTQLQKQPESKDFNPFLQFIEDQCKELQVLKERKKGLITYLCDLKGLGDEVGKQVPFQIELPHIEIQSKIDALLALQQQAEKQNREAMMKQIKQAHQPPHIALDLRPYPPSNFYQPQLSTLHQQAITRLNHHPAEKQDSERERVEAQFCRLRTQQQFINQIKIFIELYSLDEDELERNRFDLKKYKHLLAVKTRLMQQKAEADQEELGKVNEEIGQMIKIVQNEEFLIPFRYSVDLLVKAKQHLVQEYYQAQIQKLQEGVSGQLATNSSLSSNLADLHQKIAEKQKQLQLERTNLAQFIASQEKQIISIARQKTAHILPAELKQNRSVVLENKDEITAIYAELQDRQRIVEATERLQELKGRRMAARRQFDELNEQVMKTPLNVEQHLKKAILPYYHPVHRSEEEQELGRLLKLCQEIDRKRQDAETSSNHSSMGRYSSMIF